MAYDKCIQLRSLESLFNAMHYINMRLKEYKSAGEAKQIISEKQALPRVHRWRPALWRASDLRWKGHADRFKVKVFVTTMYSWNEIYLFIRIFFFFGIILSFYFHIIIIPIFHISLAQVDIRIFKTGLQTFDYNRNGFVSFEYQVLISNLIVDRHN